MTTEEQKVEAPEMTEEEKAMQVLKDAEDKKMDACVAELTEVLNRHGYQLGTAVTVQLVKKNG